MSPAPDRRTGAALRSLRLRAGLNQRELATRAGLSVRALRYLESGDVTRPHAASLHRLAQALGVDVDALAGTPGVVRVRIGVLGPLRVWHGDTEQPLASPSQRQLLGLLAVQPGHAVSVAAIVDLLWGEDPPATGPQLVQAYVAQLRRLLEPGHGAGEPWTVLCRVASGYRLDIDDLDLAQCRDLADRARQAWADGAAEPACQLYREAWSCWRGPVLLGAEPQLLDHPAVAGVTRSRVTTVAEWADVAFALGDYGELVAPLRTLCDEHPLHEGLAARLMLALAGDSHQAAALRLYDRIRTDLDEQLGVAPGPELRAAHLRVLRGQLPAGGPRASVVAPRELPTDVAAFVGRTERLAELDALLTDSGARVPVAVIAGMGGVGKTTLAVRWGHRVAHRFPGGQLYVDLRGHSADGALSPRAALTQLLRGLGVPPDRIPDDEARAAAAYRGQLAARPVLVLLDNAADADQVRPLLPGGRGSLVIATSRGELGALVAREGAALVRLDVLAPAESRALVGEMVGVERVAGEPDAVAELARLCGHLPLALRIAAANLATSPGYRVGDYVAKLGRDRLAALAVKGDTSTAIRATFRVSVDALPAGPRRAFRMLGVAPGPDIAAAAAATLLDTPITDTVTTLETLVARHLVAEPAPGRYRMHDLLRHYAAELADTEETPAARDAALSRLADHYRTGVANAADVVYPHLLHVPRTVPRSAAPGFPDKAAALAWLAAESANLVALVHHLNARAEHAAAWDIAHYSNGYFLLRMGTTVWQPMAHAAWAAAAAWGGPYERAMAELQLGMLVSTPGAAEHTARAVELARAAGWVECEAVALNNLARGHWIAGRVDDTIDQLAEALVSHRKAGRLAGEAVTLANLGAAYAERGRDESDTGSLTRARGLLDQALTLHRAIGDHYNEAETLRLLAEVHRDLDEPAPALTLAVTALGLAEQAGDTRTTINALSTIGTVQTRLGNGTAGLAYHERALNLARTQDQRHTHAQALLDQADSYVVLGRSEAAFFAAQDALLIGQQTGLRLFERRAQTMLDRVQQLVIGNAHSGQVARRTLR